MPTVREYQAAKLAKGPQRQAKGSGKLAEIAAVMYSKVTDPGDWDRVKLEKGLDIILHRLDEHQWRLALAREDVYPSDMEVEIVRAAFDVPEAADESRSDKQYTHPKTKRTINYRRVEVTWQER